MVHVNSRTDFFKNFLIIICIFSCTSEDDNKVDPKIISANEDLVDDLSAPTPSPPAIKIDPQFIRVTQLRVASEETLQGRRKLLTYDVTNHEGISASSIKLWVCPLEGYDIVTNKPIEAVSKACPAGVRCGIGGAQCVLMSTSYLVLPVGPLGEGKYKFILQACIDQEFAKDPLKLCGPETTKVWTSTTASKAPEVYRKYLNSRAKLESIIKNFSTYYNKWMEDNDECLKQNDKVADELKKMMEMIQTYISGPAEYLIKDLLMDKLSGGKFEEIIGTKRKYQETIKNFAKEQCQTMTTWVGADVSGGTACSIMSLIVAIPMSMFAEGIDPRRPIAKFAAVCKALHDPSSQVLKKCSIGQALPVILKGFKFKINSERANFLKHRKDLIDLGELASLDAPE